MWKTLPEGAGNPRQIWLLGGVENARCLWKNAVEKELPGVEKVPGVENAGTFPQGCG